MGRTLCPSRLLLAEEALAELAWSKDRTLSKDSGEVALVDPHDVGELVQADPLVEVGANMVLSQHHGT